MIDLDQLQTWEGVKVSRSIPIIRKIIDSTYPSYNGRKIRLRAYKPMELHSYWDEGSRDTFALINIQTGAIGHMASNHPFFESQRSPVGVKFILPPMCILVMHSIFLGKDFGLTLFVNLSDAFAIKWLGEDTPQITN